MTRAAMIRIYHNPRCGTSRTVLQLLQERGLAPEIVEYLNTPLTRVELTSLFRDAGLTPAQAVRSKETLYEELQLALASDDELLDAMAKHPILMNRPFVTTPKGTRLCRPAA